MSSVVWSRKGATTTSRSGSAAGCSMAPWSRFLGSQHHILRCYLNSQCIGQRERFVLPLLEQVQNCPSLPFPGLDDKPRSPAQNAGRTPFQDRQLVTLDIDLDEVDRQVLESERIQTATGNGHRVYSVSFFQARFP